MKGHLVGRRALVTGGSRGIGLAIVERLQADGCQCTTLSRTQPPPSLGTSHHELDLSTHAGLQRAAGIAREGCFDLLINVAGGAVPRPLEGLALEVMETDVQLNLTAPLLLMGMVLPGMQQRKFGRIVNITSIAGQSGVAGLTAYSAAKAGLIAATQSAARSVPATWVTINAINPGAVDTEMARMGREGLASLRGRPLSSYQEAMMAATGLGRLLEPAEVAGVVLFLVGPDASAVTGQCINVCGHLEVR
jgi:NAD(P)-dependent dehydrogenase (short-subunit alcohol dehydrogenase family)